MWGLKELAGADTSRSNFTIGIAWTAGLGKPPRGVVLNNARREIVIKLMPVGTPEAGCRIDAADETIRRLGALDALSHWLDRQALCG